MARQVAKAATMMSSKVVSKSPLVFKSPQV